MSQAAGSSAWCAWLEARALLALEAHSPLAERLELHAPDDGSALCVYLKGSAFRGWAQLRHCVRQSALRQPAPRLAEFANLVWLRAHGFEAPEPLAAVCLRRFALPRYQALLTRWVEAAQPLKSWWPAASAAARDALLEHFACELARLHGLGGGHGDCFARNLLVRPGPPPRVVWLDCWRWPPGAARAPAARDLGCWFLEAAGSSTLAQQALVLETYARERGLDPARRASLWSRVEHWRARELRRARAQPRSDLGELVARWAAPR